jgi:hypothetical protein
MPVVQPEKPWSPYPIGRRDIKPANVIATPGRPVCETCNDTHRMEAGFMTVMCTHCPTPCDSCRSRGPGQAGGPYCATTPCGCHCHRARYSREVSP